MNDVPDNEKQAGRTGLSANPPASSGEGAETALQAMIRKRRLRAEDDSPAATDSDDPGLTTAQ